MSTPNNTPVRSLQDFSAWIEDRLYRLDKEASHNLALMNNALGERTADVNELFEKHQRLHNRWCEVREARHQLICFMSGDPA